MMVPVARELTRRGKTFRFLLDSDGVARGVLDSECLPYTLKSGGDVEGVFFACKPGGVVFVGTSASAVGLESRAAQLPVQNLVFGSDGFFNHALPAWRSLSFGNWLAIDEGHAQTIRELRPGLPVGQVRSVGQPAFDLALSMIPRKEEIRNSMRRSLSISSDEKVFLWWSQGMAQVIGEDIAYMKKALQSLPAKDSVLILRLHPKLNRTVYDGFVAEVVGELTSLAQKSGWRVVSAEGVGGEELCLAADVVLSVTCTEDIKCTLMGGPPVVHFLGPRVRDWMSKDLGLIHPFLPDVKTGQAIGVFSVEDVGGVLQQAVLPSVRDALRKDWTIPRQPSALRVVDALLNIASR